MEVDTLVATLMSLGFDFDGCQQAISEGNKTVETAVDWLLNKGNGKSKAVDQAETRASTQDCEPCHSNKDKSDEPIVSRYATNESQKKAQGEFEQRQRDTIQREAKKRRLVDKQARQEILQQIKEDRDIANRRRPSGKSEKHSIEETDITESNTSRVESFSDSIKKTCKLKIRLSTGNNVTKTCDSSETLLEVVTRIKEIHNESDDVDIIQPFPHKKFTADDFQQSLMKLGLAPGGCLVLKKSSSIDIASSSTVQQTSGNEVSGDDDETGQNVLSRRQEEVPEVEDRGTDEPQEGQEGELGDDEPPVVEHPEDQLGEDEIEGGHDIDLPRLAELGAVRAQHVWGVGESLGRHAYNPHAIDPARSRILPVQHRDEPDKESERASFPSQEVSTLVDICVKDVATRLPGHHHPVGSLAPLSHRLHLKILKYLMKKKTLTPKTLNCFVPCHLQQLALDHYLYVTNELFQTIRFLKSLMHLSVQSCTIFTDKALEAIAGLKKIIHLDFSNCTQLTNKCLVHLKMHKNLETLKLNNTKVTDDGLCPLFMNSEWNKLHTLSLSKTAASNKTLEALQAINLKELHLEQTNVSELQALASLTSLTCLNVGGTRITDQSLLCLRNHPSLKKLNLHQTQVTDDGLGHLSGLQLVELHLPSRLNITDVGISYLQGLPLKYLDLTDYVNITDEALRTVGQLTGLIRLSLSKTKISDNGMQLLSGLVVLKELDLERTAVGDDGLDVLSHMVKLEELNLSGTRVTDIALSAGKLNCLRLLCKLNLSRTDVSDLGIANLILPELVLLNMDWTFTTEECPNLLDEGCPQLQALRRQNCRIKNRLGER